MSPSLAPVWPGPRLIVPMAIDCLLIGSQDRSGGSYARTGFNYQNLALGLGAAAAPPFGEIPAADNPATGAHLMWTLPYALRRGAAPTDSDITPAPDPSDTAAAETLASPVPGSLTFPLIPDRWLIVRIGYPADGGAPNFTARLISADTVTPATGTIPLDVSQYPVPGQPGQVGELGAVADLAGWTGALGAHEPFLRATAPGDMTWVAAYDNVRNVISVHDPLDETVATYTYSVIGWYSRPDADPLHAIDTGSVTRWKSALETATGWSLGTGTTGVTDGLGDWQDWAKSRGLPDGTPASTLPKQQAEAITRWKTWQEAHGAPGPEPDLPRQMMLSGMLSGVAWKGTGQPYGNGAPGGGATPPAIAVGSTAAEAIAAWLAHTLVEGGKEDPETIPLIERAIEAFQAGLLNELETDPARTESHLHATAFSAGGKNNVWTVVRPPVGDGGDTTRGGDPSLPLDPAQTDALIDLNRIQDKLDAQEQTLATQQSEAFALSWKRRFLPRGSDPSIKPKIDAAWSAITAAIAETARAIGTIADKGGTRDQARDKLKSALKGKYDIRFVSRRPSYRPSDPVILVAGAGGDPKYAGPGTYDDNTTLVCRITGQSVVGIDLDGIETGAASLDPGNVLDGLSLPAADPLPKEVPDLLLETLLLDPLAAAYLARRSLISGGTAAPTAAAIAALAARIAPLQTAPWSTSDGIAAPPKARAAAVGLVGEIPAQLAVAFRKGQPWSPVFVDWKLTWAPDGDSLDAMLANWTLGPEDFVWQGGKVSLPATPEVYQARTVFDPTVAQSIAARLSAFKNDPDYKYLPKFTRDALENMIGLIGRADLYCCAAAGMTEQLLTRIVAPNQDSADPDLDKIVSDAPVGFLPVPGDANPVGGKLVDQPFFPLRSGHFQVLDLWVVDSWGQILRGKPSQVAKTLPIPGIIRGQSVTTPPAGEGQADPNADILQLTPRITQNLEMRLDLLDAADDRLVSTSSDATSPVCGFVVPNNLDVSLAVYDQTGGAAGSVLMIETEATRSKSSETGLRWDAPPGSSLPLGAPPDLGNDHLQALVTGLLDAGLRDGGLALDTLFDHIDSVLWALAPLGQPSRGAGTLLGPPLAVVRARLTASLPGLPIPNQSWGLTGDTYVNASGGYAPVPVPVQSLKLPARIGDTALKENGVMGYFVDDDYSTFHATYGAGGQTAAMRRAIRSGETPTGSLAQLLNRPIAESSDYVDTDHTVAVPLDGSPVMLTLLVDPRGRIPVISGWQPWIDSGLPAGPVATALDAMVASFRAGPVLVDPHDVKMPLPGEIRGAWGWAERSDITGWSPDAKVRTPDPTARLATAPLHLSEGWLTLSGALGQKETS